MGKDDADINRFFESGKRVAIELGTSINFEVHGVDSRLKSSFVGMEPEKYVIIKIPNGPPGYQSKLVKGNRIIVRYLYTGTVYGFQTQIITAIADPTRLLFLEYPNMIEEHSLRSSQRVDCYLPCKCVLEESAKAEGDKPVIHEIEGVVVDLSQVGCKVVFVSSKIEAGLLNGVDDTEMRIFIQLPGVSEDVCLVGIVKSLNSDKTSTSVGISFSSIESDVEEKINSYLSIAS